MSKTLSELMRETAARIMEISPADYKGKIQHPDVEYSAVGKKDEVDKVIAVLRGSKSAAYTRMGTNFNRIKEMEAQIKALKEEMDEDLRAAVAGVFNPEDAVYTRVIETASFVFEITKDPKAASTVQYSKVLDELEGKLTPDLLKALEVIKAKYTTQQKAKPASIKSVVDKRKPKEESIEESVLEEGVLEEGWIEQFKSMWTGFVNKVKGWCSRYDQRLAALKAQVGVKESIVNEDSSLEISIAVQVIKSEIPHYPNLNLNDPNDLGTFVADIKDKVASALVAGHLSDDHYTLENAIEGALDALGYDNYGGIGEAVAFEETVAPSFEEQFVAAFGELDEIRHEDHGEGFEPDMVNAPGGFIEDSYANAQAALEDVNGVLRSYNLHIKEYETQADYHAWEIVPGASKYVEKVELPDDVDPVTFEGETGNVQVADWKNCSEVISGVDSQLKAHGLEVVTVENGEQGISYYIVKIGTQIGVQESKKEKPAFLKKKEEKEEKEEVKENKSEEEKELVEAINNLFRVTAVLNNRFAK